jgi:hypothetical protein
MSQDRHKDSVEDLEWNNDWDERESITDVSESQRILDPVDRDEDEIENEIRANLSSRVVSSLQAYKIAGLALIIALISFALNTVSLVSF